MNNLIFLSGHRKAGTTLLHTLFDGHPDLLVYPTDISLLYAYYPVFTQNPDLSETELEARLNLVVSKSLTSIGTARKTTAVIEPASFLEIFWGESRPDNLRDPAQLTEAIARTWCLYNKKLPESSRCLVKETSQAIHLDKFQSRFPGIKMVQMMRDPRDNYAALKAGVAGYYAKMGESDKETLASLINRSRMDMIAAQVNAEEYPDNFMSVRFEDLVAQPDEIMHGICAFLDISFDETLLRPTVLGQDSRGNNHDGSVFSGISSSNAGRWHERISEDEARIIEYWCKNEMEFFGYACNDRPMDSQRSFSEFYNWYNSRYFFSDSFCKE